MSVNLELRKQVMEAAKLHKGNFTSTQLANEMGKGYFCVANQVQRLYLAGDLEFVKTQGNAYVYKVSLSERGE